MKNKVLISQSCAVLLFSLVVVGCASDRFNWLGSMPNASKRSMTQKLCPVTGEPLDSMGGAIPVKANGETIYVCCKGCVKAVNNDPKKYLAIVRSES
ncbi:MAG: hypothetical protein SFV81_21185 [Pirellulaceae bacterium]|nr:hypothetical protein [Pirellulaceae bacterium]